MALGKDDQYHKNCSEGHHHGSHFLVVSYGIQSHVNPARALARRLAGTGGCAATLSVPVSGHRRMFPPSSKVENSSEEVISDGLISYIPFSDGVDDGSWPAWPMEQEERVRRHETNFRSLSSVVTHLATAGRPVTCMVCTLIMPVVVEVAREHRLPFANYWI